MEGNVTDHSDQAASRRVELLPAIRDHAGRIAATLDRADEAHRQAARRLGDWIARTYRPGRGADVIVICTGNSRRSILGSTMGNVAAAYYGLPEVRFFSGGTAPTAFNPRTIAALQAIGIQAEATGEEAPRGEPETPNRKYRVRWGTSGVPDPETIEFSKAFADARNPRDGFAAILVCDSADAGCPFVPGAAERISAPYADPKDFDDTPREAEAYAERRDDIARMMFAALEQAREELARPSSES